MKKLFVILMVLAMMLPCALADDLGVQMIGPELDSVPQTLEDAQIGQTYTLDGYAMVTPVEFMIADFFAQFTADDDFAARGTYNNNHLDLSVFSTSDTGWTNPGWIHAYWIDSGVNADYLWLRIDITNLQKEAANFAEEMTVKAVYQDDYEYSGWVRQINYDYLQSGSEEYDVSRNERSEAHPNAVVLDPEKTEPIDMMYTGTYAIGITVPNAIAQDKKSPLSIVITFADGSELTYIVNR